MIRSTVELTRIKGPDLVSPAKAGAQKRLQKLDSDPVFQRGKLKIAGMTAKSLGLRGSPLEQTTSGLKPVLH